MLLEINETETTSRLQQRSAQMLVNKWSRGGGLVNITRSSFGHISNILPYHMRWNLTAEEIALLGAQRKKERRNRKALRKAGKVTVDYRPVLSQIINDYLFRCPTWRYAHLLSGLRRKDKKEKNIYVYRFSQPTHLPGYKECWGKACHTSELPYVFQSMSVIRSNYSTLGPIAQKEAPSAPEYPYTDFFAAYREKLEAFQADKEQEFDYDQWQEGGGGDSHYHDSHQNHTYAFRRVLDHFFGDYYKEDADEEIAVDMARRWTAFARTGNPNYDESKSEWLPWRQQQRRPHQRKKVIEKPSSADNETLMEIFGDSDNNIIRRKALMALNYEVAEEDVYRTELQRPSSLHSTGSKKEDLDTAFLKSRFLFRSSLRFDNDLKKSSKEMLNLIQKYGQAMDLLGQGRGHAGEDSSIINDDNSESTTTTGWNENFFPEMLELKWPPRERILERDCTCDMWDSTNYKY